VVKLYAHGDELEELWDIRKLLFVWREEGIEIGV
jgi:hypothetical protein